MGQGFSFFRLEFIVSRSDYARYDVGPSQLGPASHVQGLSLLEKVFLEQGHLACNSWA